MAELCKVAGVKKHYTAHCLRATAIQHLNDVGYQARHILFMSSHKNESSLRSYNRAVSTSQKKSLSSTLSAMTNEVVHDPTVEETRAIVPMPCEATYRADNPSDPATVTNTMVSINATSIATTPSFFGNSSFTNCTFSFSK